MTLRLLPILLLLAATPAFAARAARAPERLVWGSNWPHPAQTEKPDDAILFDLMARWAPEDRTRRRILVDNPGMLYGFDRLL